MKEVNLAVAALVMATLGVVMVLMGATNNALFTILLGAAMWIGGYLRGVTKSDRSK